MITNCLFPYSIWLFPFLIQILIDFSFSHYLLFYFPNHSFFIYIHLYLYPISFNILLFYLLFRSSILLFPSSISFHYLIIL
jgi:hypothetical protein